MQLNGMRPSHALVAEFGKDLFDKVADLFWGGFAGHEYVIEAGNGSRDVGCRGDADVAGGGFFQDETSEGSAVCEGSASCARGG